MAFDRTSYEKNAYDLKMNRSILPGCYRLFPNFSVNQNECFSPTGFVGVKSDSLNIYEKSQKTDAESFLLGISNKITKANKNFSPPTVTPTYKNTCDKSLDPIDTRFTHPLDNYRGMSVVDYYYTPYLHINPQNIIGDTKIQLGLNSRLYSKDTFITPIPEKWDNGEALPKFNSSEINIGDPSYNNYIKCILDKY